VTRDTFGFAMKATYGIVNGEGRAIFKNPKTDDGTKKSAKGMLRIDRVEGELVMRDEVTDEEEKGGLLEVVYRDGKLLKETSLGEVRARLKTEIAAPELATI
jgi:nicotinamide phosphoribosyltransferase